MKTISDKNLVTKVMGLRKLVSNSENSLKNVKEIFTHYKAKSRFNKTL